MTSSGNWLAALRAYLLTVAAADLIWETAHLPLYTLWQTGTAGENLFAVVHCTLGDLLIALVSLTLGLMLAGHRQWPARRFAAVAAFTMTFGMGYTVFSEWLNVVVRKSWAYSAMMPIVSFFGLNLGLSPLLQWIVVPVLALLAARRIGTSQQVDGGEPCSHRLAFNKRTGNHSFGRMCSDFRMFHADALDLSRQAPAFYQCVDRGNDEQGEKR